MVPDSENSLGVTSDAELEDLDEDLGIGMNFDMEKRMRS